MRDTLKPPLMVAPYLDWVQKQLSRPRHELVDGEPVAMAPERAAHVRLTHQIARALDDAIAAAKLPCLVWADGMAVRIDDHDVDEPDAAVTCGEVVEPATMVLTKPAIVAEMVSPASYSVDSRTELEANFRIPSVVHDLIIRADRQAVIHDERRADGALATRLRNGTLHLHPLGIELNLTAICRAAAFLPNRPAL